MTYLLTYDEEVNQFSFVCPIFNAQTKMATCMRLRELKWMGKRIEKRQGCQAAMTCGKCPAAAIVDQITYGKFPDGVPDNYGSREPVLGKLRADILSRVRRPMIVDSMIRHFTLSDEEYRLLHTANERIDQQLRVAPGGGGKFVQRSNATSAPTRSSSNISRTRVENTNVQPHTKQVISDAAATGDLAAAINAGL